MSLLDSLMPLLQDPPPSMVFELSEAGVAVARLGPKTELDFRPLKAGVLALSPLKDNVMMPDELSLAVREMAPRNGKNKRRDVALILPDYSVRVAVLDFDTFPSDPKEQIALIRFRVRKISLGFTHPYDVRQGETARLLPAEHLAQQASIRRVILDQKNPKHLVFHEHMFSTRLAVPRPPQRRSNPKCFALFTYIDRIPTICAANERTRLVGVLVPTLCSQRPGNNCHCGV